jgi:hypothetical protein
MRTLSSTDISDLMSLGNSMMDIKEFTDVEIEKQLEALQSFNPDRSYQDDGASSVWGYTLASSSVG